MEYHISMAFGQSKNRFLLWSSLVDIINNMRKFIRKYFLFVSIFFLILLLILAGFFYKSSTSYKISNPINESETKTLIEAVGKLAFLPANETPTIATVSDLEMLKDLPFFVDAKMGDRVLIYTNAKKAILYDPVANKIVNMATLNTGATQKSTSTLPNFQNGEPKAPVPNQF